jgi:hypothetical protein
VRIEMPGLWAGACAAALIAVGPGQAAAAVFVDNFDAETVPTPPGWIMSVRTLANFFVEEGSVDLLGLANPFGLTGTGNFVDLDGSSHNGGILETVQQFTYSAGDRVTVSILAAGNEREGTDTLFAGFRFYTPRVVDEVTLSGFTSFSEPSSPKQELLGIVSLPSTTPYQSYSISFHAPVAGVVTALIGTDSADSIGPLLDGVRFAAVAAVPEPTTWALSLAGFGLLGAALRRRRALAA